MLCPANSVVVTNGWLNMEQYLSSWKLLSPTLASHSLGAERRRTLYETLQAGCCSLS